MSLELDEISIQQQFEEVIASDNQLVIQEFLNDQNISDVVLITGKSLIILFCVANSIILKTLAAR